MPTISTLFSPDNPAMLIPNISKKTLKVKIHPNIKFIIILATDEKKNTSNLFIFIIFPRFLKCRFIVIISTAVVFDIYISQFISIYNSC